MNTIGADDYTVAELRNWLGRLNMQKSGNKETLAARLNGVPPEARGVCPAMAESEDDALNIDLEHGDAGAAAPDNSHLHSDKRGNGEAYESVVAEINEDAENEENSQNC
ncbi:uncharacterized protein [Drosophila kikkawai]